MISYMSSMSRVWVVCLTLLVLATKCKAQYNLTSLSPTGVSVEADSGYYFGIYVAYFLGIVTLALILDRFGVADSAVGRLGESAHKSFMKYEVEAARTGKSNRSHKARTATVAPESEMMERGEANADTSAPAPQGNCCCRGRSAQIAPTEASPNPPANSTAANEVIPISQEELEQLENDRKKQSCVSFICFGAPYIENYNPLFLKKLLTNKAFYGCDDNLVCCCWCATGFVGDFFFYLFNHHSILSMFAAVKSNAFARSERRIAYFVQHSLALFFAALVTEVGFDPVTKIAFNIFVITPITLIVNKFFYYMLTCPCLIREYRWTICRYMAKCLEYIGLLIAYPMSLVSFGLLLIAATLTVGDHFAVVAAYAYQVHVVSMGTDTLMATLLFRKNTYTVYKVCGITVYEIGQWFKEYVEIHELKEGKDYSVKTSTCGRLLTIESWRRLPQAERALEGDIEMQELKPQAAARPADGAPAEAAPASSSSPAAASAAAVANAQTVTAESGVTPAAPTDVPAPSSSSLVVAPLSPVAGGGGDAAPAVAQQQDDAMPAVVAEDLAVENLSELGAQ